MRLAVTSLTLTSFVRKRIRRGFVLAFSPIFSIEQRKETERPTEGPQAKVSLFDQHAQLLRDRPEQVKSEIEKQMEQEHQIMESIKQHKSTSPC